MHLRNFDDCQEFVAGDGSILREYLHPDKTDFPFHYSLAHARVKVGQVTTPHKLTSTEVYYILDGKGLMHVGDEAAEVQAGSVVYIEPNAVQYIENIGETDLTFICIVDPAWRIEDETICDRTQQVEQ